MEQTVGRKFNYEQLDHALNESMGSFLNPTSFEQQAYFEGTFPLESNSDPQALLKKFTDIEARLADHIGEPVVCIRDGDIVLLYMGIIKSPKVIFQFDQNSPLPRGSASIEVQQLQIAAIVFDDNGGADVEVLPVANGRGDSYFHFEERGFQETPDGNETYECVSSRWDLAIGNEEVKQTFGSSGLILPARQGLTIATDLSAIETTATENPFTSGQCELGK